MRMLVLDRLEVSLFISDTPKVFVPTISFAGLTTDRETLLETVC